jgi:hypothetical protein
MVYVTLKKLFLYNLLVDIFIRKNVKLLEPPKAFNTKLG